VAHLRTILKYIPNQLPMVIGNNNLVFKIAFQENGKTLKHHKPLYVYIYIYIYTRHTTCITV